MHKSTLEAHHQPMLPVLALLLATFFWGSSFITVGSALEYTNPFTLVMLRFAVGAFFVLLMLKGRLSDIPARTWKAGAALRLSHLSWLHDECRRADDVAKF